uniref:ATP synthase complex subunit 8 n=1 Tax=Aneides flavipunctatus TaxID=154579 RepID=Q645D2_9SALA|nr:ATP synthase F0 subunit 8 [Aneides flavipunctatus]AAU20452.1 ATP synthase F0 subunit 8 [Aneides flavipunctatus]
MPQLNPSPWFLIFMMSWFIYLIILMSKTTNFKMLNKPTQYLYLTNPQPWNWLWV